VKAAISARATNWQESRQPSMAVRHRGYIPPREVIVATQPDNVAVPTKTKTTLKAAV